MALHAVFTSLPFRSISSSMALPSSFTAVASTTFSFPLIESSMLGLTSMSTTARTFALMLFQTVTPPTNNMNAAAQLISVLNVLLRTTAFLYLSCSPSASFSLIDGSGFSLRSSSAISSSSMSGAAELSAEASLFSISLLSIIVPPPSLPFLFSFSLMPCCILTVPFL